MGEGGGSNFPNFPNFPGGWLASGRGGGLRADQRSVGGHSRRSRYDARLERLAASLTRQMVSVELFVSQASVFRVERQEALYLPALSDYVSALGGELEVNAVFPDGKVMLLPVEGSF